MQKRLRSDVELVKDDDGLQLVDHLTGAQFQLEDEYAFLLDAASDVSVEAGREAQWAQLRALALLDEQLTAHEIVARQRETRQRMTRDSQMERVREVLDFCVENVPYYRGRKDAYASRPIQTISDLVRLPFIRKADLRESMLTGMLSERFDLAAALAKRTAEITATSGTTGERLQVVVDLDLEAVPAHYAEIWGIEDTEATPRTAVLTSPLCTATECHLGKLPMEDRIRDDFTLILNSADDLFSIKRALVENIAEEMHRFKPDLLLVNPVYLHWVAIHAKRYGIALPPVQRILSSYQYLSGLQRRGLQELMGAPVLNYYAATDMGGSKLGIECHRGRLHVREDQSLIELVKGASQCGQGELGALAVTTLASRVMPLVRYQVGDIGKWTSVACDCAIQDWPVLELHGRDKDRIHIDGRWITTREVDETVSLLNEIDFYKCTQSEDELRFEVIFKPDVSADSTSVERALGERLSAPKVRVKAVRRLDPEPSLKYRLTQSTSHPPTPLA